MSYMRGAWFGGRGTRGYLISEKGLRDVATRIAVASHGMKRAFPMSRFTLIKVLVCLSFLMLFCPVSGAQEKTGSAVGKARGASEEAAQVFDMKVPLGFQVEPADEPGIYKWRKDDAEIYVVVGELFSGPAQSVFDQLLTAAKGNKDLENIRTVKLKGGNAFTYTEKAPQGAGDLKVLRLIVVTEHNVINVDFTAPEKDFESVLPEFESAVKSFKLKSSRS